MVVVHCSHFLIQGIEGIEWQFQTREKIKVRKHLIHDSCDDDDDEEEDDGDNDDDDKNSEALRD